MTKKKIIIDRHKQIFLPLLNKIKKVWLNFLKIINTYHSQSNNNQNSPPPHLLMYYAISHIYKHYVYMLEG